jgi:hypothetical protein
MKKYDTDKTYFENSKKGEKLCQMEQKVLKEPNEA